MSTPATSPRSVILRLNIGEKHHHRVTEADARALADDPDPVCLVLERELDRQTAKPRQWRALARALDELVREASETAEGPARYLVVGRAPLPVFAYLGAQMTRLGPISVANHFDDKWELFGPPGACPRGGRQDFTATPPPLGRDRVGRLALSVQCSQEYFKDDASLEQLVNAEDTKYLGTYTVHKLEGTRHSAPLTAAELPVLLGQVEEALTWMNDEAPNAEGLVVAYGGPSWLAFWIGHGLNPTVWGRVDFPNLVKGRGYLRALSYPMAKAPWLAGKARLLMMNAEPDNCSRVGAGKNFDAVKDALAREGAPFEMEFRGAMTLREFMRDVERFEPDILHLHLHGGKNGDLAFEDDRGELQRIPGKEFVGLLRATGVEPALIVFNACYLATLGPALLEIAECVIGMKDEIEVTKAAEFSRFFYEALGRGNHLQRAIDQARAGARLEIVEVHTRGDLDAEDITLMPRRRDQK